MEFEQALAMHRQGRTDDAVRAYQQVSLLAKPTHLDALIHLGAIRLAEGKARRSREVAAPGRSGIA